VIKYWKLNLNNFFRELFRDAIWQSYFQFRFMDQTPFKKRFFCPFNGIDLMKSVLNISLFTEILSKFQKTCFLFFLSTHLLSLPKNESILLKSFESLTRLSQILFFSRNSFDLFFKKPSIASETKSRKSEFSFSVCKSQTLMN